MGVRYTNQRVEILNFLKNNFNHPTVEEVYLGVKKKLPRISKATVYNNMRLFAKEGMIREVNIKGVSRFEPSMDSHHHIICTNCGKIMDFESKDLTEYSMNMAKKLRDVNVDSAATNFYGKCKKCK